MHGDVRGGIEGLPLQLMIVIMVATMGSAVIMGWMGSIDSPHSIQTLGIEENVVEIEDGEIPDIHLCVLDERGEPLEGVSVWIDNKQAKSPPGRSYETTGKDGRATLSGWTLDDYPKDRIRLNIIGFMSGYQEVKESVEGMIS